jgi:hypothetical protein
MPEYDDDNDYQHENCGDSTSTFLDCMHTFCCYCCIIFNKHKRREEEH